MIPENILNRIQFLINLSKSENQNEAASALEKAEALCKKFNTTLEDFKKNQKKPEYDKEDLLFSSSSYEDWKVKLAMAVSKKTGSFIVQEESFLEDKNVGFDYFILDDNKDAKEKLKLVFNKIQTKIKFLLDRLFLEVKDSVNNPKFTSSYLIGVVDAISASLSLIDLNIQTQFRQISNSSANLTTTSSSLTPLEDKLEKFEISKEKTEVKGSEVVDPIAYIKGVYDGEHIDLYELVYED